MKHNKILLIIAIFTTLFAAFVFYAVLKTKPPYNANYLDREMWESSMQGAAISVGTAIATWALYIVWHVVSYLKHGGSVIAAPTAHAIVAKRRIVKSVRDRISALEEKHAE